MCGGICVKFPKAIVLGNRRTKICGNFRQKFAAFSASLLKLTGQSFHPNFALGTCGHNLSAKGLQDQIKPPLDLSWGPPPWTLLIGLNETLSICKLAVKLCDIASLVEVSKQPKWGSPKLTLKPIKLFFLKKREGVPEMGTKPLKALRGYRASNRGSNRGSKGSRKTPEVLRGQGPCSGAPFPFYNFLLGWEGTSLHFPPGIFEFESLISKIRPTALLGPALADWDKAPKGAQGDCERCFRACAKQGLPGARDCFGKTPNHF